MSKSYTGDSRENPEGVGFILLLASVENSEKNLIPRRFFQKPKGFFIIDKRTGWGWFFFASLSSLLHPFTLRFLRVYIIKILIFWPS